ncbi:hypothetical protein CONLIGDRAFT_570424 [Coniochaeta ligniaria NRRL 30616]|uniref:Cell cycle control protein n=1 Tax=Coniochaeta ligniaria NRRL 30616 TaxID=1408157 RepID=A0A1J7J342_9PEZI|nr:hypothetical protein CONLIGDRAFT_570424 [Coniochaeta ligniaria NRRL 30616]
MHHHGGPLANFPIIDNPLADNPVDFNYGVGMVDQEVARPKPAHIAPPEAREGFTRATGEDTVVVCPSCEEELKYDPDDAEKDAQQPPPAKKARTTRKDREEHHFWAVKACGHVYCRSCYENRRPTVRNAGQTHFQIADKRVLCAVEDCSSDVSTKTAWVGIFL